MSSSRIHTISKWVGMIGFPLIALSCLKSDNPGLPGKVVKVIQQTGFNRVELTKTIGHFLYAPDSLALKAAYFLIGNMERHYSIDYEIKDSSGKTFHYDPFSFPEDGRFLSRWKALEDSLGKLKFEARKFTLDRDTITAEILIETIGLTLKSRDFPWASNYSTNQIFPFVLPYRVGNEHIEHWRPFLQAHFLPLISDTIRQPEKVAEFVNDYIDTHFIIDERFLKKAGITPVGELFRFRRGNEQDISYLKVKSLRSLGIPASLNHIPYYADSLHGGYFAAYLNKQNRFIPLLNLRQKQAFTAGNRIPKIYQRSYTICDSSLFAIKATSLTTPPYLGHYHDSDVTAEFIPTASISFEGSAADSLLYLTVYNDEEWRATDWAILKNGKAVFNNINPGITYHFATLNQEEDTLKEVKGNSVLVR